jgi:hypothetical protein
MTNRETIILVLLGVAWPQQLYSGSSCPIMHKLRSQQCGEGFLECPIISLLVRPFGTSFVSHHVKSGNSASSVLTLDKIENFLCLKDSQGLGSYQSGREWLSDIEQLLPPIACSYADQREQR